MSMCAMQCVCVCLVVTVVDPWAVVVHLHDASTADAAVVCAGWFVAQTALAAGGREGGRRRQRQWGGVEGDGAWVSGHRTRM